MVRLLALLCALIGISRTALAADLPPSPQPVYVPAVLPAYNWGGVYIGINGGWGWGTTKWTVAPIGTGILANGLSGYLRDNGGVVGGTLRANTIPQSTLARPPASAPSAAIAKPAIIGWRRHAGAPVMPWIVYSSTPRPAALSPMCKRISTALPRAIPSRAGPLAVDSNWLSPTIGPLRSNISMSI